MKLPPVNILVALRAEAKPLATFFRLARLNAPGEFPVYRAGPLSLVVSGVGKAAARAATRYLHGLDGAPQDPIWINIGIAGHGWLPTGEALLARCITDAASGARWHPSPLATPTLRREDLITVDRPSFDYAQPAAYDMEASGFFSTASRLTRPDLVHCVKIVSDNRHSPAQAINGKRVSGWIARQQDALAGLLQDLGDLRGMP